MCLLLSRIVRIYKQMLLSGCGTDVSDFPPKLYMLASFQLFPWPKLLAQFPEMFFISKLFITSNCNKLHSEIHEDASWSWHLAEDFQSCLLSWI